jgi:cobalt-zinc-cadmium efflux system outer membrane protein
VLLGLTACAEYQPKPLAPDQTAQALEARSLADPALRKFLDERLPGQAAERHWDLTALTLVAIYQHPDLAVARAKAASAAAGVITASEMPNPTLGLNAQKHSTILNPSAWTVGLIADIAIETFGKRGHREAQAQGLADAARAEVADAAWQVRASVRQAMLGLWMTEKREGLLDRRVETQERLVGLLDKRLSAGEASALDVSRERLTLNQLRLAAQEQRAQRETARVELATSLGLPVHALDGVMIALDGFDQAPSLDIAMQGAELRRAALTTRPDLQAILAEYRAAEAGLQLAIADQYPDLTLGPGYTYDQADNQYALGVSAKLPIFNQNQGAIAEAEARRAEVAARFVQRQARIIGEIDQALTEYRGATETLATADAIRAEEEGRFGRAQRLFKAGSIDRPTLVESELELAAADLARFDAVVKQRDSIQAIEDALRQPLFDSGAAAKPDLSPQGPRS